MQISLAFDEIYVVQEYVHRIFQRTWKSNRGNLN